MPAAIENSIDIECDPDEVFDFATDPTRLPEWQPAVEEAIVDPPGLKQVGMRGQEIRRTPAGRQRLRWEVTECEPAERWTLRGTSGPLRSHVTLTFAASTSGTRVEHRIWFEARGIGRLLRPLVLPGIRREVPENLALLKKRLEAANVS